MAKVLAFKRATSEVVTVDTVNNTVSVLGASIPNVDTTTDFPHRTQNLLAVYRGDPYFIYRHRFANEVRLARYDGIAWADVPGFTALAPVAGKIKRLCLKVVNSHLCVLAVEDQSGTGDDGVYAVRSDSNDGDTWSVAAAKRDFVTQPTASSGGASIVWRDGIFFSTYDGVGWYIPSTNILSPVFDQADDASMIGDELTVGDFTFWNNDLYAVKAGGAPTLYRLDTNWNPTAPPAAPAWEKETIQSAPGVAAVNVGPDSYTWCLFTNRNDELCLIYSGTIGTKLIKATVDSFPEFIDLTDTVLPESIRTNANLGFTLSVDDRRRTNELQSFLIWEPAEASTKLARWDGSSFLDLRTTFSTTQFMSPNDRFGFAQTFTNLQPTCHVRDVNQVFPGRMQLDYTVRDIGSKPVDIFGEYSIDGDEWLPMTQGDGDDGNEQLATSPVGTQYSFFWDAFIDLDGDFDFMNMRIVARIAGV
jgi:hypothetical protein